jgi:hypothetical protein
MYEQCYNDEIMTENVSTEVIEGAPDEEVDSLAGRQSTTEIAPDGLRRGLISTLTELSDHDLALAMQRDDPEVAALRPAGRRNVLDWRTERTLNPSGLITREQLEHLRETFLIARQSMDDEQWQARGEAGWKASAYTMLFSAAERNENVGDISLQNLVPYYRDAVETLAHSEAFRSQHEFDDLSGRISHYDAIEDRREKLQAWLIGKAPKYGSVLTGALVVRQTYRLATYPIGWAGRKLFGQFFIHDVSPEDVRKGRRIKARAIGIVALAFAGYGAYRAARGFYDGQPLVLPPSIDAPDATSLPSPTEGAVEPTPTPGTEQPGEPVEPQPTQPTEPTEPTEPTPEPEPEWSEGAETVEDGEGWIHQLREMDITYSPEFMAFIWDDVGHLGYSKENPDTGAIEYFLKERSKPIPTETLDLIEERHQLFSAMQLAAIR